MMDITNTPYESVMAIPTTCGGSMKISVGKMKDEVCLCAIEVTGYHFTLINVSSSVFIEWMDSPTLEKATTFNKDLNETFSISKRGSSIRLSWGDDLDIVRGLFPDDLKQVAKHFINKVNAYRRAAHALANMPKKPHYTDNILSFKEAPI